MQRQMIRMNFWLNQRPRFITYIIMALTITGFVFSLLLNQIPGAASILGSVFGEVVLSTFVPYGLIGLAFNLFSLFFVGSIVEMLYGKWRYVLIYLLAGSIGNFVFYTFSSISIVPFLGASNAIFGAFGALGAFFIVNRRALGPVANAMLGQWVFWLL